MNDTPFLPVNEIEATAKTQARVKLIPETIDDYATCMLNGDIFPPVVVFAEEGSERYILADGFHRVAAAKKAGMSKITADIREGNGDDARRFAIGANRRHGLRRSIADKQRAVDMALDDPFFGDKPNPMIAEHCGVSKEMVRQRKLMRDEEEGDAATLPDQSAEAQTRVPPKKLTQEDIHHQDIMAAVSALRSMPFDGYEAARTLPFEEDDFAALDFVVEWLDQLVASLEK